MIPESGDIIGDLLSSNLELEEKMFVETVHGNDLSEFNNIISKRFLLDNLSTKISYLSDSIVSFSFDFYQKDIIKNASHFLHTPMKE